MANSTTTLRSIFTYARTFPAIASVLNTAAGGVSLQPGLTIANNVTTEILAQVFNWKFNRFNLPLFYTNSWQQDYALNVVNLGWLEDGVLLDVNNSMTPQPIWPLETVKFLPMTSTQYGMPGQVCWLQNNQLIYGVWGKPNVGGGPWPNPQPNQVIGTLLGVTASPTNPLLQVQDSFGNLWTVTTFGTTGATNPFISNLNPKFPTPNAPTTVATTVTDNTVVWTAVNPNGQGIRCNPMPPQTGVVYQFNVFGQYRPFAFSGGPYREVQGQDPLSMTIEPIPDDFAKYFRDGFVAECYAHSEDKNIRAQAQDAKANWMKALFDAKNAGDRERDNMGFFPAVSLMGTGFGVYPGPAYPFPTSGGV